MLLYIFFCACPLQVGVAASLNCSEGSYYSESDNSCKQCGICPENELQTEPCTATQNTVCHCKPGYYRLYPTWGYLRDTCIECSICGNRQVVANCTDSHNTQCGDCPLNYFLYNATLCAPCSTCFEGDPFAIRMKDCQEAGLPPWHQCSPQTVTTIFLFNSSIPPQATQPTFVTSSTVDSVNTGVVQPPNNGIFIAGAITVSLSGVMLAVSTLTCTCCLTVIFRQRCARHLRTIHQLCCKPCRKQRNEARAMCCCPIKCTQRHRTSSAADAETLCKCIRMSY